MECEVDGQLKNYIWVSQIWGTLICIVGTLGNLVVMMTIAHQLKHSRNVSNRNPHFIPVSSSRRSLQYFENQESTARRPVAQNANQGGPVFFLSVNDTSTPTLSRSYVNIKEHIFIKGSADTYILLHLSFCDFLYCGLNMPLTLYTYSAVLQGDCPTDSFCSGAAFFRYTVAFAEWLNLSLLMVERSVDVVRPAGRRVFKPWLALLLCFCTWLVSIALQLPNALKGTFIFDNSTFKCDVYRPRPAWESVLFLTVQAFLPIFFIVLGASILAYRIRKTRASADLARLNPALSDRLKAEMKVSITLVAMLVVLFVVCILPILAFNVADVVRDTSLEMDDLLGSLGILAFCIYWIQYGINFIVYFISFKSYRYAAKFMLRSMVHAVKSRLGFVQ